MAALLHKYGGRLVAQETAAAEKSSAPPEREAPESDPKAPKPPEKVAFSQDGTTIRTYAGWKEVKISSISEFTVRPAIRSGDDPEVHLIRHSYCAGLWNHEVLNQHFWWDVQRRHADRSPCQAAIADAAPWIWHNFSVTASQAQNIIDWWHARDYFWRVANVVFGEGSAAATAWMEQQETSLWHGDVAAIRQALLALHPATKETHDKVPCALDYLQEHAARLRYSDFRAAGYPLGSGTVESSCNTLVGARLKQAGQTWSEYGANAMLAVRAAMFSDRWSEAWACIYWLPAGSSTTS